jgi:lactate permease
LPILVVMALMVFGRWPGQRAGLAGWAVGGLCAVSVFSLSWDAWWVSQLKGLYLTFYVLAVLWPALFLYHLVDRAGGVLAVSRQLETLVAESGFLALLLAWSFSGMLEGLAGFGMPIAIIAPMLVGLGVSPVRAVAAVAVGHAWSVTFGDMGVIFQTLVNLVNVPGNELAPLCAFLLGVACLGCGLGAAFLLGEARRWPFVLGLGVLMGAVQYALATSGLTSLAAFGAGLTGVVGGIWLFQVFHPNERQDSGAKQEFTASPALRGAALSYGGLTLLMALVAFITPLKDLLSTPVLVFSYPQVSAGGFITPPAVQTLHPLVHPGTMILLAGILSVFTFSFLKIVPDQAGENLAKAALRATWRSAAPSSLGILTMVGLSTLMEHSGMTLLLAKGLTQAVGTLYPLVSPLVGILGAFATGSNNNSNVLFASLQQNVAALLGIDPRLLLAAQTAGGSLGSLLAPAKLIVGCSTVGAQGKDGEALKLTLPYGIVIGLLVGGIVWVLSLFQ